MAGPFGGGFGRNPFENPLGSPPGYPSIQVGGRTMYPDIQGELHNTKAEAILANQRFEENFNHVTGGNCGQDPDRA